MDPDIAAWVAQIAAELLVIFCLVWTVGVLRILARRSSSPGAILMDVAPVLFVPAIGTLLLRDCLRAERQRWTGLLPIARPRPCLLLLTLPWAPRGRRERGQRASSQQCHLYHQR